MAMNGGVSVVRKLSNIFYTQHHCGQTCKVVKCWNWDIRQFTTVHQPSSRYAVLILNRPISQHPEFMKMFWNNATVRITVDGGTVQWDKFLSIQCESTQKAMKLPDLITGDFDSITQDVLQRYQKKGCKTVHTPDQNYTDFTKAVMELTKHCIEQKIEIEHVIAIGQSSGRIDQILGNIQTLFLARDKCNLCPSIKVYLMSDDALSWLLFPGDHIISIPENVLKHKRTWCSLVPIGQTCESITTSGLKWNLSNQSLKFGEIVSTSNTFDGSEIVTVKCSHPVLWSMKIPGLILNS